MTVRERIALIMLSEKLSKNTEYAKRVGVTIELVRNEFKSNIKERDD